MRVRSRSWFVLRLAAVFLLLAGCAALISATKSPFTKRDKAFYADERTVDFVRPGLVLKITGASIADDGTIKVQFTVNDPKGLPLDIDGVTTPGSISTGFVVAYIPADQAQYVSYLTRNVASTITGNSAIQATADSGGALAKIADGEYEYTFKGKAPSGFDKTATHSIGIYAQRDLSEFDLGTNISNDVYTFVPNGSAVTKVRDVVADSTCNGCHGQLTAHGRRQGVQLCNLCHTPQSSDPDTGNTVDMKVMIHKIHMGEQLPSVQAGKPYEIIGHNNSVADFSEVVLPSDPRACTFCHVPGKTTQADNWMTKPSAATCGSCHDNVNFATGENHANGLPEPNDNACAQCHTPEGEFEFDTSVKGAHTIPEQASALPGTVFEILGVTDGAAGKNPTVEFSVKTKAGDPVDVPNMTRLALVLTGPTTDYAMVPFSEDPRSTATGSNGVYKYTFTNAIPADAKGTWTVGIEGYSNATLLPGTVREMTVRDAGLNVTYDFSVDSTPVVARREVVDLSNCNGCHRMLSLHGGNRNEIQQCVLCHNPVADDSGRRPEAAMPAESIDFALMVHRIHAGEEQTRDYIIYGFGGSVNDFGHTRYPNSLTNCVACHKDGTYNVPLAPTTIQKIDPRGLLNPVGPVTGACTACHTSIDAASHALANTTMLGESCGACHAANREFSVDRVHAQ